MQFLSTVPRRGAEGTGTKFISLSRAPQLFLSSFHFFVRAHREPIWHRGDGVSFLLFHLIIFSRDIKRFQNCFQHLLFEYGLPSLSSNLSVMSLLSTPDRKEHNEWICSNTPLTRLLISFLMKAQYRFISVYLIIFINHLGASAMVGVSEGNGLTLQMPQRKNEMRVETPPPFCACFEKSLWVHPKQSEDTFRLGRCICYTSWKSRSKRDYVLQ